MGNGKVAAQCSHATLGAYRAALDGGGGSGGASAARAVLTAWERAGQPKIALKCDNERELRALASAARRAGVASFTVHDAGRTQVAAGSATVLALGPADAARIDRVSGHLKLL